MLLLSGFLLCFSAYLSAWPLKSVRSHYEPWYPVRFEIISDRLQKQLGPHFGCFYTSWSLIYKIDHSLHWFCPWYFSSYGWCWWLLFCNSYIFYRVFYLLWFLGGFFLFFQLISLFDRHNFFIQMHYFPASSYFTVHISCDLHNTSQSAWAEIYLILSRKLSS